MTDHPAFISKQVSKSAYHFFDLNPKPTPAMQVVCGGWECCLPHYRVDRTDFPYFSLEFVSAGKGTLVLGNRRFHLIPGTVFHYGPGIKHHITCDPESPLEKYFIDFVGDAAEQFLSEAPFAVLEPLYIAHSTPIARLFEALQKQGRARSSRSERFCSVLLELLLLEVADTAVPLDHDRSAAWTSYDRCRRYIEEHHLTLRTIDEVSLACHLDKPYMCRLFKRYGNETPYGLLLRLKMEQAAELLLQSTLMIKEVAAAVGFDDPYAFSHVFKRVRGLSPSEYAHQAGRRLRA